MSRRISRGDKESKESEQKSSSSTSTDPPGQSKKKRDGDTSSESPKKARTSEEKKDSEGATIPATTTSSAAAQIAQIHAIYDSDLTEANSALEKTIHDATAQIAALRKENNELDSELTEAKGQIANLTAQKLEREQELAHANNKIFLVDVDPDSVQTFIAQFTPGTTISPAELMSESVAELLDNYITAHFNQRYDWRNHWTTQYLCDWLQRAFHPSQIRADKSLLQRLESFHFDFEFNDSRVLNQSLLRLIQIEKSFPKEFVRVHEASACQFLVEIKLKHHPNTVLMHAAGQLGLNMNTIFPASLSELRERLLQIVNTAQFSYAHCAQFATVQLPGIPTSADIAAPKATSSAYTSAATASQPTQSSASATSRSFNPSKASKASKDAKASCTVCGRNHPPGCRFLLPDGTSWHPNANLTSMPWSKSVQGIQYLQKTKLHTLAFTIDAEGNKLAPPADNPVHKELGLGAHSK